MPGEYSECEWNRRIDCSPGSPDLNYIATSEHTTGNLFEHSTGPWCDKHAYELKYGTLSDRRLEYGDDEIVHMSESAELDARRLGGSDVKYDSYQQCLEKSCELDVSTRCQ